MCVCGENNRPITRFRVVRQRYTPYMVCSRVRLSVLRLRIAESKQGKVPGTGFVLSGSSLFNAMKRSDQTASKQRREASCSCTCHAASIRHIRTRVRTRRRMAVHVSGVGGFLQFEAELGASSRQRVETNTEQGQKGRVR